MKESVKCLVKGEHALAESPLYNEGRNSIIYIDIADKKVCEYKIEDGKTRSVEFDEMVGTVALMDERTMIVAEKNKLIKVDLDSHEKEELMTVPMSDDMRINDGKCDEEGRLWVGSIVIERSIEKRMKKGSLCMINEQGEISTQQTELTISNGLAWDVDKNLMYFTDSYTQEIKTYVYDSKLGVMTFKDTNVVIPKELGMPDGFTIDEEGMLWVALWGGGCVLRVNPENGEILSRVEVPDKNVTCCIFGGEKLDTLYITTAADEDNKGGLYCIQTTIKGKPTNLCKGSWLAQ